MSTDGVKYVAEMGDCSFLEEEVEECTLEGECAEGSYFSWMCEPASENAGSGVCNHAGMVTVSAYFPYTSMISMAAPSPDWFVGVSNVNLCVEDGNGGYVWAERYPETGYRNLNAYDAGTDAGESFESPDEPVEPREAITIFNAMNTTNIFYNEEAQMLYPLCQIKMEKI